MQKRICLIDFSGTEITAGILIDGEFEKIDLNLPWEIGFREDTNDVLVPCFGEALDQLDPNHPAHVQFTALDVRFKDIMDEKTLEYLFNAFVEEIVHRRLPDQGHSMEGITVYAATPYEWSSEHRKQLRRTFKRVGSAFPASYINASGITLRGLLSQTLCLAAYYQDTLIFTKTKTSRLLMIDFTRHDFIIYDTVWSQLEDKVLIVLSDILRFSDFFLHIDKSVSDIERILESHRGDIPTAVGFSGNTHENAALVIINLLRLRINAANFEPQASAVLLGSAQLVKQFEKQYLEKPIHFKYHFCLGVQLPDGTWVEIVPKTWEPPYHRKRAFRVRGEFEKFDIYLYCGLSLGSKSDVHRLACLEVVCPKNKNFSSRYPFEFILSVTLNDFSHGRFAVHLPNPGEEKSVEFILPVLMD